ncbi:MAG: hypothetical protein PVH62_02195 [Anaerolineae bacterium]
MKAHTIGYLLCGAVFATLLVTTILPNLSGRTVPPVAAVTYAALGGGAVLLGGAAWGTAFGER